MPIPLIADGEWHEYSFEFTVSELFDPSVDRITIGLTGACWDMDNGRFCKGESYVYFVDFRIERTGAVPSKAANWGNVKALFR
jgi:hypothetical protein